MVGELQKDSIVASFIDELKNMPFIPKEDHPKIEEYLTVLCGDSPRNKKSKSSLLLWKILMKRTLSSITSNLRGLDELYNYYEDFYDYENLLFSIDKKYRDHIIHSIWVMLIGFYIIKNNSLYSSFSFPVRNAYRESDDDNKMKVEIINKLNGKKVELWMLIALTHDLGYPIEKTKKVNEYISKMISNYGFLKQQPFEYEFSIAQNVALNTLLDSLSFCVLCSDKDWRCFSSPGIRLDYAKSMEKLDHGIMSAYLVQLYLDSVCECIVTSNLELYSYQDCEAAYKYAFFCSLLKSISSHTNINAYSKTNNLNDHKILLFLSDEIDEFSRYGRSLEKNAWVETKCRTELIVSNSLIQMTYIFDNRDIEHNILQFYKNKVKKIIRKFEIVSDDFKIIIRCKDITQSTPLELKVCAMKNNTKYYLNEAEYDDLNDIEKKLIS